VTKNPPAAVTVAGWLVSGLVQERVDPGPTTSSHWPGAHTGGKGWRIVTAFAITQTVGYGVLYYAFAVLLQPIARSLHASTATVTGALTAPVLAGAAMAVPVGRWLDRHGGRALMTTAPLPPRSSWSPGPRCTATECLRDGGRRRERPARGPLHHPRVWTDPGTAAAGLARSQPLVRRSHDRSSAASRRPRLRTPADRRRPAAARRPKRLCRPPGGHVRISMIGGECPGLP
jgi:hypothetical protein